MRSKSNQILKYALLITTFLLQGCLKVELPKVTILAISQITDNSAFSGGNVIKDGGADITSRGLVWGTTEEPTLESNNGFTSNGTGPGVFSSDIVNLKPSTTYYVRAYATNIEGTGYSPQVSFTTSLILTLPTVTTNAVVNITLDSALSGGNVTNDGNNVIIARGICWSTSQYPTIEDNKTTNGTGTGTFTSNLTGLANSTVYYIRSYATNSIGTAYGGMLSFRTL